MKKTNSILTKILAAVLVIYIFSVIFANKERSKPRALESALLNPKYESEIKKIVISKINIQGNEEEAISILRHGDFFLASSNTLCTVADSKIIHALLERVLKVRSLYKISDKDDYKKNGREYVNFSFLGANDTVCSNVQFFDENMLTGRITVTSDSATDMYETENDFNQFLSCDINYWSEGLIAPEIKKPVQLLFQEGKKPRFSIDEKSEKFLSVSETVLAIRHGRISAAVDFGAASSTLWLSDESGRIARIEFFESSDAAFDGEKSYFYRKTVTPSAFDSQENAFSFYSENALYEISLWTYEKIKNALSQP